MPVWNTEKNNAAKDALRAVLDGGQWRSHADVIKAMASESGLAPRTSANVLRELVKDWRLQQKGSYKPGGRYASDTRAYRAPGPKCLDRGLDMAADIDKTLKSLRNKLDLQQDIVKAAATKIVELNESITDLEAMKALALGADEDTRD